MEVHWGSHGEAYVTPVAPRTVGVAVLTADVGTFDEHLADFPELAARLAVGRVFATEACSIYRLADDSSCTA